MQRIIVSDTSCLILLNKIQRLDLLRQLFENVIITQDVAEEYGLDIPEYIEIKNPNNLTYQRILETDLDVGESSCIALALEFENCLLILDDQKARKKANELKLDFTGTLGLFLAGKEKGYITSISDIIESIRKTDFRISEWYYDYLLKKAKEK